jgi:hypothetical protein
MYDAMTPEEKDEFDSIANASSFVVCMSTEMTAFCSAA